MAKVEQPGMSGVRFPYMRNEVISALESLADRQHQAKYWGFFHEESPINDNLTLNVHILYDDMEVLPDPEKRIGSVILETEVTALRRLDEVFGPLLDELGDAPDEDYTNHPRWDAVVTAAADALAVMRESEDAGDEAPS